MKKLLLIALVATASLSVLAQGKVSIKNDATRLITYATDPAYLKLGDAAKAGTAVPSGATTADAPFKAQLFFAAGTTEVNPANFTALTPVIYNNTGLGNGFLPTTSVNTPAGGRNSFLLKVWESSFTDYAAAIAGGGYAGMTPIFLCTAGSISPNPINSTISPSLSTWAAGPIYVAVPEPSTAAVAGLGLASLLIFRRRN